MRLVSNIITEHEFIKQQVKLCWPICFYAFFQDDKFKVNNLISNGGFKKWLTSAADKSGQAEVTLQLKKAVYLSYIDLGKFILAVSDFISGFDTNFFMHKSSRTSVFII